MEIRRHELVTPKPYFEITAGCSTRQFYSVKGELKELSYKFDKDGCQGETWNDYVSEKCDYEGDLEKLIIHRDEKISGFVKAVMGMFGLKHTELPEDVNIEIVDL